MRLHCQIFPSGVWGLHSGANGELMLDYHSPVGQKHNSKQMLMLWAFSFFLFVGTQNDLSVKLLEWSSSSPVAQWTPETRSIHQMKGWELPLRATLQWNPDVNNVVQLCKPEKSRCSKQLKVNSFSQHSSQSRLLTHSAWVKWWS